MLAESNELCGHAGGGRRAEAEGGLSPPVRSLCEREEKSRELFAVPARRKAFMATGMIEVAVVMVVVMILVVSEK
jgi:hypothetical protein